MSGLRERELKIASLQEACDQSRLRLVLQAERSLPAFRKAGIATQTLIQSGKMLHYARISGKNGFKSGKIRLATGLVELLVLVLAWKAEKRLSSKNDAEADSRIEP